jgi:hypothetical protein
LSNDLVTIQAKHKLRLSSDPVMPCNFRRDVTINLDHLQKSIFARQVYNVLVSDLALRIPAGSEIDEKMGILALEEMSV